MPHGPKAPPALRPQPWESILPLSRHDLGRNRRATKAVWFSQDVGFFPLEFEALVTRLTNGGGTSAGLAGLTGGAGSSDQIAPTISLTKGRFVVVKISALRALQIFVASLAWLPLCSGTHAALNAYDFDTTVGVYTASGPTILNPPAPPDGTGRIRIGTQAGSFTFANPGNPSVGSATELVGVASSGTSVNKFSVYGYSADKSFYTQFTMYLTGGSSGYWQFFQGAGTMYSDNNSWTGAQIFTGIEWSLGAGGTVSTRRRVASSWTSPETTTFAQNTVYRVEIYGNNSTTTKSYMRGGTPYSVAANQWDMWVNGTRYPGLAKGGLAGDTNVDSFVFMGGSSISNVATIILDDFLYGGDLSTAPVAVSQFSVE
jgi:hypothetical protein